MSWALVLVKPIDFVIVGMVNLVPDLSADQI